MVPYHSSEVSLCHFPKVMLLYLWRQNTFDLIFKKIFHSLPKRKIDVMLLEEEVKVRLQN